MADSALPIVFINIVVVVAIPYKPDSICVFEHKTEIWSLSLKDENLQINRTRTSFDIFGYILQKVSRDPEDTIYFFLGWRIWKMRNKLIFENKRDHIIHVLSAAYVDLMTWKEALNLKEPKMQVTSASNINSVQEVLPEETELYCIVDASWKSPNDKIGIGWSLHSKEGTPKLQGSSAMDPTTSPIIAETMALWTAAQQLHRFAYTKVIFLGDCLKLLNLLQDRTEGKYDQVGFVQTCP
ncbi:hypothetical protein N665_0318s0015 [Sinapis alba]|nr:hypothetical protein N665_0318s0015 [Sinapis alba]